MTKLAYYDYIGKCGMVVDPFQCYLARQKIDKEVNATNTSAYNIYAKCWNNNNKSNTINLGCEDESGATAYLNDPHFRQNWNIREGITWKPCDLKIWNEYHSGNGSLHLVDGLIKDGLRFVLFSLILVGLQRRYGFNYPCHRHQGLDQLLQISPSDSD